ncbi:DNA packaging protein [Xanthobacter versatilis]|uniref:DNA packaging protein n=1 Tax=Xanthobacter autotrophicus (strain ATCC BAA-1158 / Py2) TaxID=78245 RepID=UPI00372A93F2
MHGSETIEAPTKVRKVAFARLVNVSPGRVSQMIAAGLPVEADGRIDVARGKLWIQGNVSPTRSAAQAAQGALPFAAVPDAAAERLRLVKEQADHAALKNAALRREMVPAAEVEREWAGVLRQVRAGILAVPSRLRQLLPGLTPAEVEAIDAELRRVLEEMADGK